MGEIPEGPWWAHKNSVGYWAVSTYRDHQASTGDHIGSIYGANICMLLGDQTETRTKDERAIAHAIAAVPELVEALDKIEFVCTNHGGNAENMTALELMAILHPICRAALAKAKGEGE